MTFKHPRFASAVSLTEAVVAMAILAIAALGGLGYQYYVARHSRIARAEIIGMRTAQLLLEDWKSIGGSKDYDPSTLGLGFSSALESSESVSEGAALYSITVDKIPMQISLQWIDRPGNPDYDDQIAKVTLRELSVTVSFTSASGQADEWENVPPVILTTYVSIY